MYNDDGSKRSGIAFEKSYVEDFKENIKYLCNVMYTIDGSSGKSLIINKKSHGVYIDRLGNEVEKGELPLNELVEISSESLIIDYSLGCDEKPMLRYISKDEADRLLL